MSPTVVGVVGNVVDTEVVNVVDGVEDCVVVGLVVGEVEIDVLGDEDWLVEGLVDCVVL